MAKAPEWKRRALESWPDLADFLDEGDTIYDLFFELLARCQEAHQTGDGAELDRIYGYADWCARQEEHNLWNAAGVAFYEHLVDEPEMREAIPYRVKPDIYRDVRVLFQLRLGDDAAFAELEEAYRRVHGDAAP